MKERASIETITPAIAERLLRCANEENRIIRPNHTGLLVDVIGRGDWLISPDAATFTGPSLDEPGRLLNAQHRLTACVRAKRSIEMICYFNAVPEVFDICDRGIRRTPGDVLRSHGVANANAVAATYVLISNYLSGSQARDRGGRAQNVNRLTEFLSEWPLAAFVSETLHLRHFSHGMGICAALFLGSLVDRSLALSMADGIATGADLPAGSPRQVLRKRLESKGVPQPIVMALTIKAFNAERYGKRLAVIKFLDSETYPVIDGCPLMPRERGGE